MRAVIALTSLLTVAGPAFGAPEVDRAALGAAIDRELRGVPRDGRLDVAVRPDGTALVTYIRPDGVVLSRAVTLPPRREDAAEMLALLAGNLVRDQSGDVLADLTLLAPAPPRTAFFSFS